MAEISDVTPTQIRCVTDWTWHNRAANSKPQAGTENDVDSNFSTDEESNESEESWNFSDNASQIGE